MGLGTYIARVSITLAACLHIAAACYGIGKWDRPRQLLLLPGVILGTALYTVFWLHVRTLPDAENILYSGYYPGRPDVAFAMSVSRGVVLTWYCAFSLYAYLLVVRQTRPARCSRWHVTSPMVLAFGFAAGICTGLVVVAEALTDHIAMRIGWLPDAYSSSLIVCFIAFSSVYFRGAVMRPVGYGVRSLMTARDDRKEADAAIGHALDINSYIDDKLVLLVPYADPAIRRETNKECDRQAIPYNDRLVVLAAATIVTLRPENLVQLRRKGEQALASDDVDTEQALELLVELSTADAFFMSDAYLVAALACGAEERGVDLRRTPQPWHRRLGSLFAGVLDRYDQPDGYREAYLNELLRREKERQSLARDLSA
jgi:hypothetical protein